MQAAKRLLHIDLLTRCHQTPAFSHLHFPVQLSMLHCPPPGLASLEPLTSSCRSCPAEPRGVQQLATVARHFGRLLMLHRHREDPRHNRHDCSRFCHDTRSRYSRSAACTNECDCFFAAPGEAIKRRLPLTWRELIPSSWRRSLKTYIPALEVTARPSHLAMFEDIYELPEVRHHLNKLGYSIHTRFFHELRVSRASGGQVVNFYVHRLLLITVGSQSSNS